MHHDNRGLRLTTVSAKAAAAFDHLIAGYLTQRADTPASLDAVPVALQEARIAESLAGSAPDLRLALERVAGLRAIPPERFIAWREAAKRAAIAIS